MSEDPKLNLDGVAETLLITLYIRAMESQRPDALIKDDRAVELVRRMESDFSRVRQVRMDEDDKVAVILRNREFDRYVRDFLSRFPCASVVHIGCGLDSRFERVDDGKVEWYDLDLPDVIELRRKLVGGEGPRHHLLGYSAFDPAWLQTLSAGGQRPFLFIAEGVFMYFEQSQVKSLVLALRDQFPGSELVFDTFSPFMVRMNNLRYAISKLGARFHWGLGRGRDVERWGSGITLVDEWFIFDRPEPRLAHLRWMRHIPMLSRVIGIFHYRLGG
jgi:methyltransferase (TIGR00027 family)